MLKTAFIYTGKKLKKWFFVMFYIILLQSAFVQIISKVLSMVLTEETTVMYLAYSVILAVATSPFQLGVLRVLKCLHQDHRFRPNLLYYDFCGFKRIVKALLLGVLNGGLQTAVNIISKYTGAVSAGGAANIVTASGGIAKMPFVTGMLSAALTVFIFMINYIYVDDDSKQVFKVWGESFKLSIKNIPVLALVIFASALINYVVCQLAIDLLARLFIAVNFVEGAGAIALTICAYVIQSALGAVIAIFQYGIARQILGENREELLAVPEKTENKTSETAKKAANDDEAENKAVFEENENAENAADAEKKNNSEK